MEDRGRPERVGMGIIWCCQSKRANGTLRSLKVLDGSAGLGLGKSRFLLRTLECSDILLWSWGMLPRHQPNA